MMCAIVELLDGRNLESAGELLAAGVDVDVAPIWNDYCLCAVGRFEMRRALDASGRLFRETDWGWQEEERVQ